MTAQVAFVAGQSYPIPPGPDGNPIQPELAPPPAGGGQVNTQAYSNGYGGTSTVNVTIPASVPVASRADYVRWYGFYRTRNMAMKASVMRTFHSKNIPDGKIRLAWQGLLVTCASGFSSSGCANSMWPLSDSEGGRAHRTNFYNWVRGVPASSTTPLPVAYGRAGQYLMQTGLNSPWAHLPGTTQLPEVSCRRSYQVMFTDGGWNGGSPMGESDNLSRTLPDNTAYTPRGPYAHSWSGTLADVAFHYWATDLQTGANFQNDINPISRVAGVQRFGNTDVAPYWNPNNNPASWQHLVTFAIAYGEAANITNPQWGGSTTAGPQFAQLVDGSRQWPTHPVPDLWHAAVNSRGAMFLATDQTAVDAAFKSVMDEIASQNVASGGAASSYSLDGTNFRTVRAGYLSAPNLRGTLAGFGLNASGLIESSPKWEGNAELAKVQPNNRVVLTAAGAGATGAAFRWNALSTWQKAELDKSMSGLTDSLGTARVDYLRGDTSRELTTTPPAPTPPPSGLGGPYVYGNVGQLSGGTSLAISTANVTRGAFYIYPQSYGSGTAARPTNNSPVINTVGNWLGVGDPGNPQTSGRMISVLSMPAGTTRLGILWGSPGAMDTLVVRTTQGSQAFDAITMGLATATSPTSPVVARYVNFEVGFPGATITEVEFGGGGGSGAFEIANVTVGSGSALSNSGFRWRQGGLLGTIVNAEPKLVGAPRAGYTTSDYVAFRRANLNRTPVAYVGANDGMLHGFNALDGKPLLSYVPRGVYPNLSAYTDPAHMHRMYVDGPLITADWNDGTAWRTILIGALGAGGRGLFALDITSPQNFAEGNASSIVRFDHTAPPVAQTSAAFLTESGTAGLMAELSSDMGHIATDPARDAYLGRNLQVMRMRNGKWALITGNGVNSVNERAVLYVIYLDGSGYRKFVTDTTTGQGNGLATPLPVDLNTDGLVDFVYAGDMLGRLWKFDLSSTNDNDWKVVQVSGVNKPLIEVGRPITSAPAVAQHPNGGLLVTFGTGRSMTDADRASTTTEYLYGVWDKPAGPFQVSGTQLVERTLAAESATTSGGSVYARVLASTSTPVDYGSKRGWRITLGVAKERVVFNPIVQGRLAYYSTYMPATASSCAIRENGSLLTFDVIDGAQPLSPVIDINGDGLFSTNDRITGKDVMGRSTGIGRLMGLFEAPAGSAAASSCSGDTIMGASGLICAKKPPGPGRRAWRDMRP